GTPPAGARAGRGGRGRRSWRKYGVVARYLSGPAGPDRGPGRDGTGSADEDRVHLAQEGVEVPGRARGDERVPVVAAHDRPVDPGPARVERVRLERRIARERLPLDRGGLDERPRPVADGRDGLACRREGPDEAHGVVLEPQRV